MLMILTRLMQASSTEQQMQLLCSVLDKWESVLKVSAFLEKVIGIRPSALSEFEIDYSKFIPLVESVGVKEKTVHFLIAFIGLKSLAARPR